MSVRSASAPAYGPNSPQVAFLAQAVPDDLLLVHAINDSTNRTLTTPTGWTLIDGPQVGTANHISYLFGRIADGTALDNFSAVLSGAASWLTVMIAVAGPFQDIPSAIASHAMSTTASGTAHATPAIQTTEPSQLVVAFFSSDSVNAAHDWSTTQLGFGRVYGYAEGLGQQFAFCCAGPGPNFPALIAVNATVSSAEQGNEHVVAITSGLISPRYAIATETQVHGLEMEDDQGDLLTEDGSVILEEEPIGGFRLEDDSGAILSENADYLRLELDQSLATDRLLTEDGLGVLVVESASPWFQHYSLEDASGNLLLEDGSGSLTSEGLLFYSVALETGDRLVTENGERLISEEPETVVVIIPSVFSPARVRAILQAVGRSGSG